MEAIKNLSLVLIKPSRVFEWIRENPKWWVPVIVLIITSVVIAVISAPLSADFAQKKLLSSSSNASPEQLAKSKQIMESPILPVIAAVSAFIGIIITILIQSGLLHLGAYVFGGRAKFTVGIATVAYAQVPIIIQQIIQSIYMAASGKLVMQGLSALIPGDQIATPLGALLGRIDIFSIWSIILLIMGFSITYKITKGKAAVITIGYWVLGTVFVILPMLLSMAFRPVG